MTLPAGDIQFYDNFIPSLDAGQYQIVAEQAIPSIDTGSYFQQTTQTFELRAPQFSLDPSDVGEEFPPDNSNLALGDIQQNQTTYLPTIVLNTRALPWERLVTSDRTVPWLALLSVTAAEVMADPVTKALVRTGLVSDLLAKDPAILKPFIDPSTVPPDVLNGTCQSVVVTADAFNAAMPRLEELRHLAHVRETDTAAQATSEAAEDGWYAVLLCNRFPDCTPVDGGGTRNYVFLVSVEGLADKLDGSVGFPWVGVQLAVLANWSFVAVADAGESFAALATNLVAGEGDNPANLLPTIPAPSSAPARLAQGYVPFAYRTATGEETFAWYRGPFTPVVPQALPPPPGESEQSSSALTIYIEEDGVFDLSYAAAFEIGRAMALADRAFVLAFSAARGALMSSLHTIAERLASGRFDDLPPARLAERGLMRKHFLALMENGFARDLRHAFENIHDGREERPRRRGRVKPRLRELLAREDVVLFVEEFAGGPEMDAVTQWLAQLALFDNVPFDHLIPDQRMLPVESIRFFYIDPAWSDALLDGALSIGVQNGVESQVSAMLRAPLRRRVQTKIGHVRAARRRLSRLGFDAAQPQAAAGLLIRSALVAGWPGLIVQADSGNVPILRMDFLSSNVLLVLFAAVPEAITISEPWHGLRFGVEDGALIQLRDSLGAPLGQNFPSSGTFSQFLRGDGRTLAIDQLVPALSSAAKMTVTPSIFATEMILSPEVLSFTPGT